MTADQFLTFANVLPEPMCLVWGDGRIVSTNRKATDLLGSSGSNPDALTLSKFVVEPPDTFQHYLRLCSMSKVCVPGSFTVRSSQGSQTACRFEGAVIVPRLDATPSLILLRFVPKEISDSKFSALNREIESLTKEIRERRSAEIEAYEGRERLLVTLSSIGDGVIVTDALGNITFMNPVAESLTGWPEAGATGRALGEVFPIVNEETRETVENPVSKALTTGRIVGLANHTVLIARNGKEIPIDDSAAPIKLASGKTVGVVLVFRDISERKRSEKLKSAQQTILEMIATGAPLSEVLSELVHGVEVQNPKMTGSIMLVDDKNNRLRIGAAPGLPTDYVQAIDGVEIGQSVGSVGTAAYLGKAVIATDLSVDPLWPDYRENALKHGLRACWVEPIKSGTGSVLGTFAVYFREPTEPANADLELLEMAARLAAIAIQRSRAEEALFESQTQLVQSQKMEAVGKLAGGIAHDFNNMLTAIIGYSEMTLHKLEGEDPLRINIVEIKKAAERAASLTQQLLAFSRKQLLQPRVMDINTIVNDMDEMLRRLIGEDVELITRLDPQLDLVMVDPGQVGQVVMNLVVNARDAMPTGGTLTIESSNVYLSPEDADSHVWGQLGHYVILAVSDTGCGMDEQTSERIFEPFFTTKEVGKGTGLGLSTVYGIIKQSNGYVWVYSEPGLGTTFKIYFPRIEESSKNVVERSGNELEVGYESVLVVEDEPTIRLLYKEVLEMLGYRVSIASDGHEAIEICGKRETPFDLVITDVVMPGMGGRILVENLKKTCPQIKVLFMSGYTDDAILRHGVLDEGLAFLQKPFSPAALASKVRDLLDEI